VKEIPKRILGGRQGDETGDWATAAVVMVRTLMGWRLGLRHLDRDSESDGKLTHTHTECIAFKFMNQLHYILVMLVQLC